MEQSLLFLVNSCELFWEYCFKKLLLGGQAKVDIGKVVGKGADVRKSSFNSY